jgi:hypothetical protein
VSGTRLNAILQTHYFPILKEGSAMTQSFMEPVPCSGLKKIRTRTWIRPKQIVEPPFARRVLKIKISFGLVDFYVAR